LRASVLRFSQKMAESKRSNSRCSFSAGRASFHQVSVK
jgi:hypothetical protein